MGKNEQSQCAVADIRTYGVSAQKTHNDLLNEVASCLVECNYSSRKISWAAEAYD